MPRNGGIKGPQRYANNVSSVGIWGLKEQQKAQGAGNWRSFAPPPPPPPPPFSATGGTITTNGSFTIHSFTSPGTFSVTGGPKAMHILVVAGGAGGGDGNGGFGGGGAGGLVYIPSAVPAGSVGPGTYPVTVGGGGGPTGSGSDSILSTLPSGTVTAKGGGSSNGSTGLAGGSSGGCDGDGGTNQAATQPTQPGPSGTYGYGNAGGQPGGGSPGGGGSYRAGGGGGAGGAGQPGASTGNGGAGLGPPILGSWIPTSLGVSGYFSKGGQGGVRTAKGTPGGGSNTGGGGGGGNENSGVTNSDPGSSGIVVIGYLT